MKVDLEEVLSALQRARGKGLSIKHLPAVPHRGRSHQDDLRRGLAHLLKEGRASYDGQVYREANSRQRTPAAVPAGDKARSSRRAPAALLGGSRRRRGE